LFRQNASDCVTTLPALAWPHASACERFDLIGSGPSKLGGGADVAGGELFTATDDGVVRRTLQSFRRGVHRVQQWAQGELTQQFFTSRLGQSIGFFRVEPTGS